MIDTRKWGLRRRSSRLTRAASMLASLPTSPPALPLVKKATLSSSDCTQRDTKGKPAGKIPDPEAQTSQPSNIPPAALDILKPPLNFPAPEYACLRCGDCVACTHCTAECYIRFRREWLDPAWEKIEIRWTKTTDLGVFVRSGCTIKDKEWIGEYLGEPIPPSASEAETSDYAFTLPGVPEEGVKEVVIDSEIHGNWTRFLNSHCDPNVTAIPEQVGKVRIIAFRARRQIDAGEQLLIFYGRQYFTERGIRCCCDAQGEPHLPPENLPSSDSE